MAPASKEVATKDKASTEVALYDYGDYAGQGFENQTAADRVIPFVKIMQVGSKEVKAKDSTLRAGQLVNSATGEVYASDKGLLIVPAITDHVFVEYRPRSQGSGFVGRHKETDPIVQEAKAQAAKFNKKFGRYNTAYASDGTETGNELTETFYVHAIICDEKDALGWATLAFDSTDIKVYKKWNEGPAGYKVVPMPDGSKAAAPMFSHLVRVTTEENKYPGGDSFNFVLKPAKGTIKDSALPTNDPRFQAGAQLCGFVKKGLVKVAVDQDRQSEGDGVGSGKPAPF